MCGIVCLIQKNKNIDPGIIKNCLQQIEHRGPDDKGYYHYSEVSLAQCRLSIIDLTAGGHQPMLSADGRYSIVFNGEIYNFEELRTELELKGYQFSSKSDTEVLLQGYIEYGTGILNKLNGIFAFCLYDKVANKLLVARDQFGVKPLYYSESEDYFIISSEIKAMAVLPAFDKTPDAEALMNYITYLWSAGEVTPFLKVKKLRQGHFMEIDLAEPGCCKSTIHCYYSIPLQNKQPVKKEETVVNELEQHLLNAVNRQLMSDVPVGFFLSGGLDSSLIVALAKKLKKDGQPLNCFTVNLGDDKISKEGFESDLKYARLVAKKLDCKLYEIDGSIDILNEFDSMIWHLDEPQADVAPLYVQKICRQARAQGIKVLLGGTGGDDLFSGYRRHQALNFEKYFAFYPKPLGSITNKIIDTLNVSKPFNRRAKKLLSDAGKTKNERLTGYFSWLEKEIVYNLFTPEYKLVLQGYNPNHFLSGLLNSMDSSESDLNKMLYLEMNSFLPDHNLNYTDKLSMAEGVEVRVPYLDKDLVEYTFQIPAQLKLKSNETKYILKKCAEKYLPKEIIYRSKTGFGAPVRKWITEDMEEMIHDRLSVSRLKQRGIFDPVAVWKLIDDNKKGKIDASYSIWCLLAIESWMIQFVDNFITVSDNILM